MPAVVRGIAAVPVFTAYAALVLVGVDGDNVDARVTLLALGAFIVGYLAKSRWSVLIASPFAVFGGLMIAAGWGQEAIGDSWGGTVLVKVAFPIAACAVLGAHWGERASD